MAHIITERRLVSANELLATIFSEEVRPSLRWLRQQQARRTVPFIKVGARVFFDPSEVLATFGSQFTVRPRDAVISPVAGGRES